MEKRFCLSFLKTFSFKLSWVVPFSIQDHLPITEQLNPDLHCVLLTRNRTEVYWEYPPAMCGPYKEQRQALHLLGLCCCLATSGAAEPVSSLFLQWALHIPCDRGGEPGVVSWLLSLLWYTLEACATPRVLVPWATLRGFGGGSPRRVVWVSAKSWQGW